MYIYVYICIICIYIYMYNMYNMYNMYMNSLNLQNYNYNVPDCIAFQRRHTLRLIWHHGVMDVVPQLND